MPDTEKIKMRINIAGQPFSIMVGFDEQDFVRETESHIAQLFESWKKRFPSKKTPELMAMMTYQYASYYFAISQRQSEVIDMLEKCNKHLDDSLLKSDNVSDDDSSAVEE